MIPRVVYQTWYTKQLPPWLSTIQTQNQIMNPEIVFRCLDDQDIDEFWKAHRHHLPTNHIMEAYYRINPHYGACRADIFRYAILYVFGGIYLDIKIQCKVPFREWISFEHDIGMFSYWKNLSTQKQFLQNQFGELQNWFLIFQPRDPLLARLLVSISHSVLKETRLDYIGKGPVLYFTGPLIYTMIMEPYLTSYRLFSSWKVLEYGDHTHEQKMNSHYSRLREPLFLKRNHSIPSVLHHVHRPVFSSSTFCPGLYLFSLGSSKIHSRQTYPLSYLCNGIDRLFGYVYPILLFGSILPFTFSEINTLLCANTSYERIEFDKTTNRLTKRVTIIRVSHSYHVIFHHRTFLIIDVDEFQG